MKNIRKKKTSFKIPYVFLLISITNSLFSQDSDSTIVPARFGASVTVTTKGISTVPNLTLGKPAIIFDMIAGKRLTFEPQFRFALEGKPWSFLFWWRYNIINSEKFRLNIGMHPAISFRTVIDTTSEVLQEYIRADRYLAGELSPVWYISENISLGIYYLYSRGLENHITRNTNLISLRTGVTFDLAGRFFTRLSPQVYCLFMDENSGYYFNGTILLARRNFPLSFSMLVNQSIKTDIPVGEDFLWNASLIYTFSRQFVEKR